MSVFARVAAFVRWLLAPEKLDCLPEHGLDRTRPYYGPIYGRKSTFLAWLLSWEELPLEGPAEASSSTRPTFMAYLFLRESLPLMPIIFLFSAVMSGMAAIIVLYQALMKLSGERIDGECVQSLARWLWLFTVLTVTIELLEIIMLAYEKNEEWLVIAPLLGSKLAFSFIGVQLIFGSLIPIILLGIVVLMRPFLTDPLRNTISFLASIILLIQVFAMRWNVVIGGQIFSKSMRGFRESYVPGLFGKEGIAVALMILIIPFVFMALFNKFLPLYERPNE